MGLRLRNYLEFSYQMSLGRQKVPYARSAVAKINSISCISVQLHQIDVHINSNSTVCSRIAAGC